MNRKKIRNDLNQQNRKKEAKPVPREYGDQRRKVKRIASPESGISFAKDVSSSGTNLNKKIEKELARLDQVEKNIRTHKSKVKAICTSTKPQIGANVNQRKLKNVLERMLETIDSSRHKTKKIHATGRKDLDLPATIKKIEKTRRNVLDSIFVESLTNLNKIKKNSIKVETPKKEIVTRKSVLKKPTSAPIPNCNVLADDLRFAENLNFGKGVVRHSTFSAVKKLPSTKNIVQKSDFRVVVEKTSANNLSYVYDSTSLRYVDPASLSSVSASNLFNEPVRTTVLKEGFEKTVETKQIKRQESKPERKKFYSFLRRGNFTISHHDSSNKAKNSEDRDFENKTECRETEKEVEVEDVGIGDIRVVNDDKSIIKKSIPGDIEAIPQSALEEAKPICELKNEEKSSELSVFPTDLLERSILAVEKVLQTIDSMTKELCMRTDIKSRLCFESEQSNSGVLIRDSSIDKLLDALPDKQPVSDIPKNPRKVMGLFLSQTNTKSRKRKLL
ncbi:hypothetical protein HHI36_011924 [Cryptolaemus montrouzieri]|uniref:Uncharacterized protein n=1 Tax=Cryptolaemus montrouzieri TaxID=559131 RepID=A0ABD2NDG3_9CUCU